MIQSLAFVVYEKLLHQHHTVVIENRKKGLHRRVSQEDNEAESPSSQSCDVTTRVRYTMEVVRDCSNGLSS